MICCQSCWMPMAGDVEINKLHIVCRTAHNLVTRGQTFTWTLVTSLCRGATTTKQAQRIALLALPICEQHKTANRPRQPKDATCPFLSWNFCLRSLVCDMFDLFFTKSFYSLMPSPLQTERRKTTPYSCAPERRCGPIVLLQASLLFAVSAGHPICGLCQMFSSVVPNPFSARTIFLGITTCHDPLKTRSDVVKQGVTEVFLKITFFK